MAIKTVDMDVLASMTGNIFESVAILAKRSRQLARNTKSELDEKLAYFEGFEQELEDPRFQEEQARVSLEYEKKPEPTERAIEEMIEGEVYFRTPSAEDETGGLS
jgi:DNA-directed RNA polymerase subunit K/omega